MAEYVELDVQEALIAIRFAGFPHATLVEKASHPDKILLYFEGDSGDSVVLSAISPLNTKPYTEKLIPYLQNWYKQHCDADPGVMAQDDSKPGTKAAADATPPERVLLAKLLEACVDFGSYAKVLMFDNHVTDDYLEGYREKFEAFEAAVDAAAEGGV